MPSLTFTLVDISSGESHSHAVLFYCDRYGELSDQSHSFVDDLEYHSEIDKLTGRLELLLSQIDRRDDDEISLMDMYFDQFEAQQQTEQNKQFVRSALKKLRPDAELSFFALLERRRPNIKTSYYDEALLDSIRYTVSEQMGLVTPMVTPSPKSNTKQ